MNVADLGPTIITGTGTDVGKTVATAAMAAFARLQRVDVGICKPIQTGLAPGEPGDADEAARLSGVSRVLEVRRRPIRWHPRPPPAWPGCRSPRSTNW